MENNRVFINYNFINDKNSELSVFFDGYKSRGIIPYFIQCLIKSIVSNHGYMIIK